MAAASGKNSVRHLLGLMLREAGEASDRVGCWLQGSLAYLNRHRRVMSFAGTKPQIGQNVFVAPSASVIGRVSIGNESSIWYNTVLRGDVNTITIGERSNVQDRVVVHVSSEKDETGGSGSGSGKSTVIGSRVTVESGCILHGCTLEDECYIGIGSTVLDGATIGQGSMIAPGSTVLPGTRVPAGELWAGSPAKYLRALTLDEQKSISTMSGDVFLLSREHQSACEQNVEDVERDVRESEIKEDRLEQYQYSGSGNQATAQGNSATHQHTSVRNPQVSSGWMDGWMDVGDHQGTYDI